MINTAKQHHILATLVLMLSLHFTPLWAATQLAPDFTLKSLNGENLRLSELRGEVVMINFWASWCGPCRQEMPLLEELYQRYQPLGFTLLGINVEQDDAKVRKLSKELGVSFPILFDNDNRVSKDYAVSAMPTTLLIDRDGNQRFLHQGFRPGYEQAYQEQIRQLVKE
ncbi:MAG: redoxin [Gammaproteobacteria bacterium (ex Lamellibrachia satsuma)]|nr:MAG: TlpA family protein disulfide reductase [Gammaproteobacteria bacterium (ex Lamellibrachia satsuma)]RRS33304.1 MAG: redoxin [Gammaproteobacteria bacterium (ex Lamellibrachia satsuma)]RRS35019.1 MAG: redoxin [Gammaproteobacteria bacterium (ex Lamellibrachia satsuma)]